MCIKKALIYNSRAFSSATPLAKLFKEKNETFHFLKYFGIAFINYIFIYYIFIQQNTYKIHYIQSFLKLQF